MRNFLSNFPQLENILKSMFLCISGKTENNLKKYKSKKIKVYIVFYFLYIVKNWKNFPFFHISP